MSKPVPGFDEFPFRAAGFQHRVLRKGDGSQPGVLIIQELPGITHHTMALAEQLHADGFTVYLPVLLGEPDSPYQPLKNLAKVCISDEFRVLTQRGHGPVADYLRALCRHMQAECGGPVGAIGMCFTGGFVLTLMIDESVAAPVMSQPAHADGILDRITGKVTLGVPAADFTAAKARSERDAIPLMGLRFTHDISCPNARFDYLSAQLGERFRRIDIDSSLFNAHGIKPWAHSVLTIDFVDQPGHPTRYAYDQMVGFFRQQLGGPRD